MILRKHLLQIPLVCSSLVVGICMATLATCFLVGSEGAAWLPVTAVCVCILAYGAGLAPVPMVYMAEVFTFQVSLLRKILKIFFQCLQLRVFEYLPTAVLRRLTVTYVAYSSQTHPDTEQTSIIHHKYMSLVGIELKIFIEL